MRGGENINSGSLNSAVSLNNIFNNTTNVAADHPQATAPRPPRAISQIQVDYSNLSIGSGGIISVDAGNSITAAQLNSNVLVFDNVVNVEMIPNIFPSLANIAPQDPNGPKSPNIRLNIPDAAIGSGGDIILQAGENINTGLLNSSVLVGNESNNRAIVTANNPEVTTDEVTAPLANELQVEVTYGIFRLDGSDDQGPDSAITLGSGGTIEVDSDRAAIGDVNSSIRVNSNNIVFARVDVENDAVANSFANSRILLNVVGDRPGNVTFDVADLQSIGNLDLAASTGGENKLDAVAFANGENLAVANNSMNGSNALANGQNIIVFDSAINTALIAFDLDVPEVDYVIYEANNLPSNNIQPVAFNICPVNAGTVNQGAQAIETSQGKIYPARGIALENGQIRLTAKTTAGNNRTPVQFKGCN